MNVTQILSVSLIAASVYCWFTALIKTKSGKFFEETPLLYFFGNYVWGDALVISLFWLSVGILLAIQLVPTAAIAILVLSFYLFRSAFEVVYWLNHQSVKADFAPPLTRGFKLTPEQGAILYQLGHFLIVVTTAAAIWLLTFGKELA